MLLWSLDSTWWLVWPPFLLLCFLGYCYGRFLTRIFLNHAPSARVGPASQRRKRVVPATMCGGAGEGALGVQALLESQMPLDSVILSALDERWFPSLCSGMIASSHV